MALYCIKQLSNIMQDIVWIYLSYQWCRMPWRKCWRTQFPLRNYKIHIHMMSTEIWNNSIHYRIGYDKTFDYLCLAKFIVSFGMPKLSPQKLWGVDVLGRLGITATDFLLNIGLLLFVVKRLGLLFVLKSKLMKYCLIVIICNVPENTFVEQA